MNATRKIKRTMKKAKPNNYVPRIKVVGNKTDTSKFVGADDYDCVVYDTEFTGEQVGEYFAISGMKEH